MNQRRRSSPGPGCSRCSHLDQVKAERSKALEEVRRDFGGALRVLEAQREGQALSYELLARCAGVLDHLDTSADELRRGAKILQRDGSAAQMARARLRLKASRLSAMAAELRPFVEAARRDLAVRDIKATAPGALSRFGEA